MFAERPEGPGPRQAIDLKRTPAKGSLKGIITCERSIGTYTHFWQNRTFPCPGDHCPACSAERPRRWHQYLTIQTPKPSEHILFECTDLAAKPIFQWLDAGQTLRGSLMTAYRQGSRLNSPVKIEITTFDCSAIRLFDPISIEEALQLIWSIDGSADAQEINGLREEVRKAMQEQNSNGRHKTRPTA